MLQKAQRFTVYTLWSKYLYIFVVPTSLNDVMCIPIQVVLASMASLEAGFSHDIFVEWATDAKNLVLFTERAQV